MKLLLVSVGEPDPCYPSGPLYLQAWLRRAGHEVDILEACYEDPLARIESGRYGMVGISAMTVGYETAVRLAQTIKARWPNLPVVLGGIHISTLPESLRPCFDIGVIGEGEETLTELADRMDRGESVAEVHGTVQWRDGARRLTPPRPPIKLDDYPHLDYSSLGRRYFRKQVSPYFADVCVEGFVFSARGCPFKCSFCATTHFWNRFRYFPVDWVIEEIKLLTQRGATHIYFSDDLFAASKGRLAEILRRLKEERLDHLNFAISANASMLDDETCALLKEMNVGFVFIGFESGDDRSLAYLKCGKNTVEMNRQAILRCAAHGLMCWGAVIVGLPGETEEAIRNTVEFLRWARRNGSYTIGVNTLIPFPGTAVWEEALKMGRVSVDMDFDRLRTTTAEVAEGFLVPDSFRPQFRRLRQWVLREGARLRWKKVRLLFRRRPLAALRFALGAGLVRTVRLLLPSRQ